MTELIDERLGSALNSVEISQILPANKVIECVGEIPKTKEFFEYFQVSKNGMFLDFDYVTGVISYFGCSKSSFTPLSKFQKFSEEDIMIDRITDAKIFKFT